MFSTMFSHTKYERTPSTRCICLLLVFLCLLSALDPAFPLLCRVCLYECGVDGLFMYRDQPIGVPVHTRIHTFLIYQTHTIFKSSLVCGAGHTSAHRRRRPERPNKDAIHCTRLGPSYAAFDLQFYCLGLIVGTHSRTLRYTNISTGYRSHVSDPKALLTSADPRVSDGLDVDDLGLQDVTVHLASSIHLLIVVIELSVSDPLPRVFADEVLVRPELWA